MQWCILIKLFFSKKRKVDNTPTYTCSTDGSSDKLFIRKLNTSESTLNQSSQLNTLNQSSQLNTSYSIYDAEQVLQETENALNMSEAISNEALGSNVNTTVNDLLNNSQDLDQTLSTGKGKFHCDEFIDTMISNMTEEEKKEVCDDLFNKFTKSKALKNEEDKEVWKPMTAAVQKSLTIIEKASAGLITTFKSVTGTDQTLSGKSQIVANPTPPK